jgi:putative Holliday junction resolvase
MTSRGAPGRLAGIDFGTVRIGVALTDARRTLASPYGVYRRCDRAADAEWFRCLARDEGLVGFVVGLPVHNDGSEGLLARQARAFGAWLEQVTRLRVEFFDERFTTVEANSILAAVPLSRRARSELRDKLAAQLMLAAYLESQASSGQGRASLDGA